MSSKILKKCVEKNWDYIFVFVFYFIINLGLKSVQDDFTFTNALLKHGSFINWLTDYYNTWSGRLIPHALLVVLLQLPQIVIQVLNALMLTFLVVLIKKICFENIENIIARKYSMVFTALIGALLIFGIKPEILEWTVYWKCATVLYVWGLVGAFASIIPFLNCHRNKEVKKLEIVLALIGAVYASNYEQTALFMIAFMVIISLFLLADKRKIAIYHYILMLISVIGLLIALASPGNAIRYNAEIVFTIPYYGMYSLFDRLMLAISFVLNRSIEYAGIYLLIISILTLYILYEKKERKILLVANAIVVGYYSIACVEQYFSKIDNYNFKVLDFLKKYLYNYVDVMSEDFNIGYGQLFSTFMGLMCVVVLFTLIFAGLSDKLQVVNTLLWSAYFCEALAIGITPAFANSAGRGMYISCVLIIMVMLGLLSRIIEENNDKKVNKQY